MLPRDWEKERVREGQRERERKREGDRDRQRETEGERERDRDRNTHRERDTERTRERGSTFLRGHEPHPQGPTLTTSFNPDHLPRAPAPLSSRGQLGLQHRYLGRTRSFSPMHLGGELTPFVAKQEDAGVPAEDLAGAFHWRV